jgi:hypothetical protein
MYLEIGKRSWLYEENKSCVVNGRVNISSFSERRTLCWINYLETLIFAVFGVSCRHVRQLQWTRSQRASAHIQMNRSSTVWTYSDNLNRGLECTTILCYNTWIHLLTVIENKDFNLTKLKQYQGTKTIYNKLHCGNCNCNSTNLISGILDFPGFFQSLQHLVFVQVVILNHSDMKNAIPPEHNGW